MQVNFGFSRPWTPRRFGVAAVLTLAGAVHLSLFWLSHVPEPRGILGDEWTYWLEAQRLASGAPGSLPPLWPRLYPRFLAGLISVFGADFWMVEAVQTLMLLAVVLLIHDLTRAWTNSELAGAAAGAMALIYPPWVAFAHYLWPEVLHLFLFLSALWILVRRARSPAWLVTAGFLLGLAVETKNLLVPFIPILVLGLGPRDSARQIVGRGALISLGFGLVLTPLRFADTTYPSVVESAAAFNIWVGLNDRARKEYVDQVVGPEYKAYMTSAMTTRERNAILWRKISDKIREHSVWELLRSQLSRQYFRLFDKDSFLTHQLPGGVQHGYSAGYHDPSPEMAGFLRATSFVLYAILLLGAVLGIVVRPPRQERWLWIVLAFLAYNLALFLVIHVKSRFRIQFLPFLFLYFGCAVAWLATKLGWAVDESHLWNGRWRRTHGMMTAAGAALFLFLAFGGSFL